MKTLFRFLSLSWMALIFTLSSLTGNDLNSLPAFSDILGHGLLYFVLGSLLYLAFDKRRGKLAVLIAILYGLSDEFHQSFVPGRSPEIKDLIVDTTAALASVIILKLIEGKKKSRFR